MCVTKSGTRSGYILNDERHETKSSEIITTEGWRNDNYCISRSSRIVRLLIKIVFELQVRPCFDQSSSDATH